MKFIGLQLGMPIIKPVNNVDDSNLGFITELKSDRLDRTLNSRD